MVEWYRADAVVDDVMADTEQLVGAVSGGSVLLDGVDGSAAGGTSQTRTIDAHPPFLRMTVCEAFERWAGASDNDVLAWATDDEDRYFRTWVERVEPRLAEIDRALFIVDYPASQASLARRKPSDERFCERFELYVAGVELCNGFGELTDPQEQRERFVRDQQVRAARSLPVYPIDDKLLAALEKGLPPCAGNALGVDRLAALVCGTTDIRSVLAFSSDDV
jgi:lysyl-tRNA synthetase class 2